jgi:RimJ/RimL family protein N-acetyltransferase
VRRTLRAIEERDLLDLHLQDIAPRARAMGASEKPPDDLEASLARWRRELRDGSTIAWAIDVDDKLAGWVGVFFRGEAREVAYWLDEAFWGQGHATWALGELLERFEQRPLTGRVVKDNLGSQRVLEKNGFMRVGEDRYFSHARGCEVEEWIFALR